MEVLRSSGLDFGVTEGSPFVFEVVTFLSAVSLPPEAVSSLRVVICCYFSPCPHIWDTPSVNVGQEKGLFLSFVRSYTFQEGIREKLDLLMSEILRVDSMAIQVRSTSFRATQASRKRY